LPLGLLLQARYPLLDKLRVRVNKTWWSARMIKNLLPVMSSEI
jgi:hypothetical protein